MVRNPAVHTLLSILILSGTLAPALTPAQAYEDPGLDGFFDSGAGGSEGLFQGLGTLREAGKKAGRTAPARPAEKPSADLYYFTPEEAAEAAKRAPVETEAIGTFGYTFDSNVPKPIQEQVRGDLAFIGGIQGGAGSKLHQQIFGGVDGPGYTRFFESRVRGIGMNSCGGGNAVACVIPFLGSSRMWLTQNYVKFSHPQVARMMVVFHESRHTEVRNGNWSHAYCPDPFRDASGKDMTSIWTGARLAGEPACDSTPFGSYGSSMIMLKNIQKSCANCTDKVKMDAGIYADDQFNRVTDSGARRQIQDDLYR